MTSHPASLGSMYSERERELDGRDVTPSQPALAEFKDVLFSLVHLCRSGSRTSSAAMSPKGDGSGYSRSQSIVSDDYSSVPPEEPEWLLKVAATRTYSRGLSNKSRPGSRRDSGLAPTPHRSAGSIVPSPLRSSFSVATLTAADDTSGFGSGAPSPRTADKAHQALFERFGSYEGLSAAVDDFYYRLCGDERIGSTIKQVPEQDVRFIMMQLMALSMQQQQQQQQQLMQHTEATGADGNAEDRRVWIKRCLALLSNTAAATGTAAATAGDGALTDELTAEDTSAVYDAVMGHMLATLERLGVSTSDIGGEEGMGGEEDCTWGFGGFGPSEGSTEGTELAGAVMTVAERL